MRSNRSAPIRPIPDAHGTGRSSTEGLAQYADRYREHQVMFSLSRLTLLGTISLSGRRFRLEELEAVDVRQSDDVVVLCRAPVGG